ncbi:WD40 repeat-like protein [Karstenula rhodostoma CBS 690.94]|uniref:WD40 repeat-like protein n=1 Tax=Karstenula rhodostoma CBS 690.94 TaxID=1392251 RepID=A0A9P4PP54_9PLEO|nr:WD40 repeat-like protein [Karstenula rhodostoma CBS 690.94]
MSLTPTNPRIMNPTWGSGLKLTPSPSPFLKSTPLRSPMKAHRAEASLALRQVIGTSTSSANSFDSLPNARSFAFCAGAAAVLATVDDEQRVSQRFYRARPTANPINPSSSVYGGPSTPTQNESRNRTAASLRESGIGASPLGSPANDWSASPGGSSWSARDRIKAATCVAFSPDGKYLAVGEAGHRPRVLIFSTAPDAPSETPLTALSDHTFGVRCLAFSPDSQYLASLGSPNDGFLYIWSINPRTGAASLYASNKCTSTINRMAWMGNSVVTVGTRHVKVWRMEDSHPASRLSKTRQSDVSFFSSSMHKTLPGRNCILESLLEANFTSVVAVAPSKAVVATDKGQLCLIDDSDGTQRFFKVAEAGIAVTSMAVDSQGRLHLASSQGGLKTLNISETIEVPTPPPSPPPRVDTPTITLSTDSNTIEAVGSLLDYLVTVDSQNSIRLSHLCAPDDDTVVGEVFQKLPAHGDPVLGVAPLAESNLLGASFYTWSTGGTVLFWNQEGTYKEILDVPLEQIHGADEINELKTVASSADASVLATGDKYGVLRIIDRQTRSSVVDMKAHSNEITGIAMFESKDMAYIASSARDRHIQILRRKSGSWELLQTLDEHVGAVTGVLFSRNGERLISMSSDRTLVVRELASRQDTESTESTERAFIMLRTIILKSSPVSMTLDADQDDVILVSTVDRHVHKYDLRNGQCLSSFRASDTEGGDAVVLSSLAHIPRTWGSPLIAGVSSTDKSIRIYEENGTLVARDWGHTEGVRDITLFKSGSEPDNDSSERSLVTVAADGTIFVWGLLLIPSRQHMSHSMDLLGPSTPSNKDLLASKPPLRRVFSQSELAQFQRSEDDQSTPTGKRSPTLRKKFSKFSLASTPRLEPSPTSSMPKDRGTVSAQSMRRINRNRSPSPPSPRHPQVVKRRSSVDVRLRSKQPPATDFGSLTSSTESLCRALRAYRKRIANSNESLGGDVVREVERELALTARVVGERAKSNVGLDETTIQKLLDQYSERLVNILDERISASVALHVRHNSESSGGLVSPMLPQEVDGASSKEVDRGSEESATSTTDSLPDTAPSQWMGHSRMAGPLSAPRTRIPPQSLRQKLSTPPACGWNHGGRRRLCLFAGRGRGSRMSNTGRRAMSGASRSGYSGIFWLGLDCRAGRGRAGQGSVVWCCVVWCCVVWCGLCAISATVRLASASGRQGDGRRVRKFPRSGRFVSRGRARCASRPGSLSRQRCMLELPVWPASTSQTPGAPGAPGAPRPRRVCSSQWPWHETRPFLHQTTPKRARGADVHAGLRASPDKRIDVWSQTKPTTAQPFVPAGTPDGGRPWPWPESAGAMMRWWWHGVGGAS